MVIAISMVGLCASAAKQPTRGVIRVKLQPQAALQVGTTPRMQTMGTLSTGISALDRAAKQVKAVSMRRMLPYAPKFEAQRAKYGLDQWYVVTFDENVDPVEARRVFALTAGVEHSEVVVPMSLKEGEDGFRKADTAPNQGTKEGMPFNDPRLPQQWHYQNYGNHGGWTAGADINLFNAWKISTGDPSVLVAVIDGGVDYKHEDLAANMCINEKEANGTPGVDDDGNGFVDDIYGYNFCTNSSDIYPHDHGTHVAGTVAAVNNNGIGVAGVAGGDGSKDSGIRMISCQVFDSRSGTGDGDFAAAIVYAAERGACIAQCSWGWDADGYYEQAVLDAIDYFTETARSDKMTGGLCIFASGNSGVQGDFYPGCYDKVLSVAAITSELHPAPYATCGEWVDIAAPGGLLDYASDQGVLSTLPNDAYGFNEGTSMATPHVSGVAALILSKYGSKTFVNENLRNQLLTSVNDLYGQNNNEQYRELYGVGYLDATKAMSMGDGTAPEKVNDLHVDAAQDYLSLSWTIPASSDNIVNHHIIYYATEPFDASADVSTLSSKTADTRFLSSGETFTYELTGLKSMTTYYVAVVAVNRQGQASAMSDIISITTNQGPEMTISAVSLTLNSTAEAVKASTSFNIGNNADGLLKWSAAHRTVSARPQGVARPTIGAVSPYAGKLGTAAVRAYSRATAEYEADDYPQDIFYHNVLTAHIGDTDRSLPNSMAQWFRVDPTKYPNGFNLTDLYIEGANGTNPVIQIYKGDVAISSASLIQEVNYQWFAYGYNIALNEQLYFAPGESFWVAVHFSGNQEGYPLGLGYAEGSDFTGYSYMSNDMGKTWSQLPVALKGSIYEALGNQVCWAIKARSLNPDWSEVLEINPSEGQVRKDETQEVNVSADGNKLVNGTYKFNLRLKTNENNGEVKTIPVNYTVNGNEPKLIMPKVVDFGSLLVGQSKTLSVEAYNSGFGKFSGSEFGGGLYSSNISSTSEDFIAPDYLPQGFPARTKTAFEVTFTPKSAGTHSGSIVFTDYAGRQVKVLVQGTATEPAKLAVEPAIIEAGTLNVEDAASTVSFKISNQGKYPLEYVFPKFSDETVEGATGSYHKFGYTVASTLEGYNAFEYDGNPELLNATDIASKFTDDDYVSAPVNLGFSFPYYGKNYDQVYITSYGGVMFAPNTEGNFWPPLTPNSSALAGTGLISIYGSQLYMNPSSKVLYAKQDGKFVVKFVNVLASVYASEYIPVSFHMTLSANGDIEMFYDDYNPESVFQSGSGLFCGITDPELHDALSVTNANMADYWGTEEPDADNQRFRTFGSGTAVKFEAPKAYFVQSLSAPSGMVAPGETVDVAATVKADESMNAGATVNNLVIVTNDPNPALSAVRINAVIAGTNLKGIAELEETAINFGQVFRTADKRVAVTVKNTGKDALTIESATFAESRFTLSNELPVEIAAGMSKDLIVVVPTESEGKLTDVLNIHTTAGDLTAQIEGEVIGCPDMVLNIESIKETLPSGTPLQKVLTVENKGNEALTYAIAPDPMVALTLPEREDSHVSYTYSAAVDDSNVTFDWVDIENNGLGTQHSMSYYMLHDFVAVDLPFDFPFYGEKYKRMYIYNTGFISFTERRDDKLWPEPPADFPQGTVYNNMIAPYWGLHSMDQTKTAGTYYYVTEDRAVVSFMEYGNSMNLGVCFQVILEKDGKFKFQYKGYNDEAAIMGAFGLAGITNADASDYIRIPERMIAFNNAIQFKPVTQLSLAPGQKDEVGMGFNTDFMAGDYSTTLNVTSNVPGQETTLIPVNLHITGKAAPVWPEDMVVEQVMGYQNMDFSNPIVQMGAAYDAPFSVKNEGTAEFTIIGAQVGGPVIEDPDFGWESPAFMLMAYAPELDWITGEPTGNYAWSMYDGMTPLTVGKQSVQFSIPMMQNEIWGTPGETEVPVTFSYVMGKYDPYGEEEPEVLTQTVNVKFVVTPMPVMAMDREEIYAKAETDNQVITETVNLMNAGEYKLKYTMYIDPTGEGEQMPDMGGGVDPMSVHTPAPEAAKALAQGFKANMKPLDKSENVYDCPSDFDYLDALYYPAQPGTTTAYNYGSNSLYEQYKAATVFTAPAEGFNISHIYTPVSIEDAKNVNIKIEVIQGNDPEGDVVLGQGSLFIQSQNGQGQFFAIPLENSVFINPGESFCVVITYPEGIKYPSYLCPKEEGFIANRYYGWTEGYGWFDVASVFNDQYGSIGYMMTCLETQKGETWVKLVDTPTEGEIEVEGMLPVTVQLNAATARLEKQNKAMLVIKSNDPSQPIVNFPITLDKNGRPVIEMAEGTILAPEGITTPVTLTIDDPDQDEVTISLNDVDKLSAIASVTMDGEALQPNEDGSYTAITTSPMQAEVHITPRYGDEGNDYTFVLSATDKAGHSSKRIVRYNVEHSNRAPICIVPSKLTATVGGFTEAVTYDKYFFDPDGDEMTYELVSYDSEIVEAYTTTSGVTFLGKKSGKAEAVIAATDVNGSTSSLRLTIEVTTGTGIDDVNAQGNKLVTLLTNPVKSSLIVKCNFAEQNARFELYSTSGTQVASEMHSVVRGGTVSMNVSSLPAGQYILKVNTEDSSSVVRVIKQ